MSAEAADRLRVTEVFLSLQGEAATSGAPTVFIRLTGCPLRCRYCDTPYAFSGGNWREIDDLVAQARGYAAQRVCVTGGEPLAQGNCRVLLERLCDAGLDVSLETSGAIDIAGVDSRVSRVLDLKTPGSGESERNLWSNIALLAPTDQVKFVICNREDFDWARAVVERYRLAERCLVFFSPSHEELAPADLADWMLERPLDVRLQVQLHKYLWGDVAGR